MLWYEIALALISGGALAALFCGRKNTAANWIGGGSLAIGSAFGIVAVTIGGTGWETFFQIPILVLAAAGALYSPGYLAGHGEERSNIYWFFFNLTAAAMLCVTLAEKPLPFLLAWEFMGLTSGALVMFDRKEESARRAAWLYFAACHAGGALLMLFFLFPGTGTFALICAVAGFGLKIGFPLLHVWLPEAHPAAPAPVSALMSGAMISLGYFGLFRFAGTPETFKILGWILLVLGLTGSLGGIIFALPQNNLKRLLAYSSVENMGLIGIAAGLGMLGVSGGIQHMAQAGFYGALLHVINHALLKGGLFLGAGAILKSTGTLELDRLGGLMRKMPLSGTLFALNSAGLCGLPPFNGFIGELVIYYAAFAGIIHGTGPVKLGAFAALATVALTGGIAAAALAKAVGAAFLGEARSVNAQNAKETTCCMNMAILLLFGLSLLSVTAAPVLILSFGGETCGMLAEITARAAFVCIVFTVLTAFLLIMQKLLSKRGSRRSATWDCGYSRPDKRMEYTGTAFTQPLADFFEPLLRIRKQLKKPHGFFPVSAELETEVEDGGTRNFWRPLTELTIRAADRCHALQSGYLHFYIVLILLTTGVMLVYAMLKG